MAITKLQYAKAIVFERRSCYVLGWTEICSCRMFRSGSWVLNYAICQIFLGNWMIRTCLLRE